MTMNNVVFYILKRSSKPTKKKMNFISLPFVHFKVCHRVYCACSYVDMYFDQIRSHKLSRVKTRAAQESKPVFHKKNCQFKLFFFSEETFLKKAGISGQYLDMDVHVTHHTS